jgi:hypothetical protein
MQSEEGRLGACKSISPVDETLDAPSVTLRRLLWMAIERIRAIPMSVSDEPLTVSTVGNEQATEHDETKSHSRNNGRFGAVHDHSRGGRSTCQQGRQENKRRPQRGRRRRR